MQEEKIVPVADSECSPEDNSEFGQEIPNKASTSVTIDDLVQNEIILDHVSVEPVNLNEHLKEGVDPFVDILAPDDVDSNEKDDTESEDEYVYMSDDNEQDCDVPYENNDQVGRRPGPKSKTRNVQSVQDCSKEDVSVVETVVDEAVQIDSDENNTSIVENGRTERRSTRNATKLKTYEIDSLFDAQIEQSRNLRPKRSQRNDLELRKHAIQEEKRKMEKDLFETPLNAPFIDTSSDEDYFKTLNPEPRCDQRQASKSWAQSWNRKSSEHRFRKKRNKIPDDIFFNPKTPLHVLYSYEGSSSEEEVELAPTQALINHTPTPIIANRHQLRKMPPVHKIEAKKKKQTKSQNAEICNVVQKPTVFQRLDDLKRMFKATGIKIKLNDLVKGSKTFQERCDRIRDCLQENGIRGRPTLAKCKRLKKQLKAQKQKSDNNESSCKATNEPTQIHNDNVIAESDENQKNDIKIELDKHMNPTSIELNENLNSTLDDGELKSEENIEPTSLVETILDATESNIDAINQIFNSELPNDLIECAVESVDYFEQVRNI